MNFLAQFLKALYQLKYPENKRNAIRLEIPSISGWEQIGVKKLQNGDQ
jgi:hypothetical protein